MDGKNTLELKSKKTMHTIIAIVLAMLASHQMPTQASMADSIAVTDSTAIADSLIARADTLNGVVVTAKEIVRYDDHLLLYPNKNQRQHAANGFDVVKNMMLPGVTVDRDNGSISAMGATAALYVNGLPADVNDIKMLRPKDIIRIEYFDAPRGKYSGYQLVVNFIAKKYKYGGYVMMNGSQTIGYNSGNYNASATLNHNKMTYSAFVGGGFSGPINSESSTTAYYNLPSKQILRSSEIEAKSKSNSLYGQMRLRYQNKQTSLTSYFGLARSGSPGNESWGKIYEGDDIKESYNFSKSSGLSPSVSFNGEHSWHNCNRLTFSLSGSYSHNKYDRSYTESGFSTLTNSKEDAVGLNGDINYAYFKNKWSLSVFTAFMGNMYNSEYSGTYDTQQHMWQHDVVSLLWLSYYFNKRLSISGAGGFHWQYTDLRGAKVFSEFFPRAQFYLQYRTKRGMLMWKSYLGSATYSPNVINDTRIDVNPYMVKIGTPDLKRAYSFGSTIYYSGQLDKLKLMLSTSYSYNHNLLINDYYLDNDNKIVQSYAWGGRIHLGMAYAAATYSFTDKFEVTGSVSYLHTSVKSNISKHNNCITGSAGLKWYIKDFSLTPYISFYSKSLNYMALSYSSYPTSYGLQATYSRKNLYVALNCLMPFNKLKFKNNLATPLYGYNETSYNRSNSQYLRITISYSFDFGRRVERVEREKSSASSSLMTM